MDGRAGDTGVGVARYSTLRELALTFDESTATDLRSDDQHRSTSWQRC
jgi:hypothetical protein